jgi:7,8-dihydropterin-6-yl-methyl-4-(beta-D-ribofuranosyl)aminobenzene 5'-phosphate synthase
MIKGLGCLTEASLSILAEDTIEFDTPFEGRFGLSVLLELRAGDSEKHVLFDTNTSAQAILHNLEIMGKSLERVSTVYLSHCHYDHTDGLPGILEALGRPVPVLAHPEVFRPCFEINPDGIRHIGIVGHSRSDLESRGAVFTLTRDPVNLMAGVVSTGEIERLTPFEELEDLYTISNGSVVQDHERDDSALILNLEQGLVVLTGCCHAGIVNTLTHARRITGVERVYAVMGGLHLIGANEEKTRQSVKALQEVDWVFAGHCTGFDGLRRIGQAIGDRLRPIHTGTQIRLPVLDPASPARTIPTVVRDRYRF